MTSSRLTCDQRIDLCNHIIRHGVARASSNVLIPESAEGIRVDEHRTVWLVGGYPKYAVDQSRMITHIIHGVESGSFAQAIERAAVRLGLIKAYAEPTGPQLLMLLDDITRLAGMKPSLS
ncbi:hypothetical protein [Acerihabitans arboris]|uniref:Uncharacterized protein n=1 Tax=Acerihabitans arboris TaxID=2691583 RepID=A0A845SMQ8_9GAMM|nr:hypothetical protein [Acerihabitans arboris]NDL64246.1 hypothetical protein [Acerihabitans arboris]